MPDAGGATDDLASLCAAALARDPDLPVLGFEGGWLGWGDLSRVAAALLAALRSASFCAGAPVCLVPRNRPEAVAALLGLIGAGHSVRMVYAFQSDEALARAIATQGCSVAIIHRDDWTHGLAGGLRGSDLAVVLLDQDGAELAPGHERVGSGSGGTNDAPAIHILTSGTTGSPKSFRLPFETIARHMVGSRTAWQGADPKAQPPFLLYFPLGNISGIYSTLPTLLSGQRAVLLERFSLDAWLDHVRTWRPAHSGIPPACMAELMERDVPPEDLASLRAMGIGAAPLDPALHRAFEERYGIPILLSYGATEFAGPVAAMTPALHAQWGAAKIGSVGRPLPGVRLRILDPESGTPLAAGETGLLQVITPRIGPDWIATTDLAHIDSDGFLWLHGRADGAIIRGGFKLLPETIEQALLTHPAVAEAGVTGVADRRLGAVPGAVLRLRPGIAAPAIAELADHVRRALPATHVPVHWRIVPRLPRTPSLKIDRSGLARLFAET